MIRLQGVQPGQAGAVRMRWKVGYLANGQQKEETGSIEGLPAAL